MPHCVGDFEDSLLTQQRFDFISGDDVALLQRFNGEILAGVAVLRQDDLPEVSAAENAKQSEAVEVHSHRLRVTSRLISAVAILKTARNVLTILAIVQVLLELQLIDVVGRRYDGVRWHRVRL